MKTRRLLIGFGLLLLLLLGLISLNIYRGFYLGKRIDVTALKRNDHALFAGQKRTDGSIDYLEAVERLRQNSIPPEENFAVALLSFCSGDWELSEDQRQWYANRLHVTPDASQRIPGFKDLARQLNDNFTNLLVLIDSADVAFFREQGPDQQLARKLLRIVDPSLDRLLQELDRRPYYYVPFKTWENNGLLLSIGVPLSADSREYVRWLMARSSLRIATGSHQKAWSDIRAVYQLANRLSQQPLLINQSIGQWAQHKADAQLMLLLHQPGMELSVLETIQSDLQALPLLANWKEAINLTERATMLDLLDRASFHDLPDDIGDYEPDNLPTNLTLRQVPWGWVSTTHLANEWNQHLDDIVKLADKNTWPEVEAEAARLDAIFQFAPSPSWENGLLKSLVGITPRQEATSMARELAFSHSPMSQLLGRNSHCISHWPAKRFRMLSQRRMLRMFLAIRVYESRQGSWPTEAYLWQPQVDPEVLINPFTRKPFVCELRVDETTGQPAWHILPDDPSPINTYGWSLTPTLHPAKSAATQPGTASEPEATD